MDATLLSRRRFLGTAGVTVTLPMLPSLMFERNAARAATCAPMRFLAYFLPSGFWMDDWRPTGSPGPDSSWQLGPGLASLNDLKSELVMITGIENQSKRREFGDHSIGCGALLTARKPEKLRPITNSSVDQIIKDESCGAMPSLQLGTHNIGGVDVFGTFFTRSISWRGPKQQLPGGKLAFPAGNATPLYKEVDPQKAFDNLFGGIDPTQTAEDAMKRRALRKSVLDAIKPHRDALRLRLDAVDQTKVEQLFTGIRELEAELQRAVPAACKPGARPAAQMTVEQHVDVMGKIIALAFQCDIRRVATFMLGDASNNRDMSFIPEVASIGGELADHRVSHHQNQEALVKKYRAIGRWKIERVGAILRTLRTLKDADGKSLLDNTLFMVSSDIADGQTHAHRDLPLMVAGKLGDKVRTNRWVRFGRGTDGELKSFGDFYIRVLALYGIQVDTFGDDGKEPLSWT